MNNQYLEYNLLDSINIKKFTSTKPFPWLNIAGVLTPDAFSRLYENFPPLSLFESHLNIKRAYGQRPHNRYYLAYENSIYHDVEKQKGVVNLGDLPEPWQEFITELQTSQVYHNVMAKIFGVPTFRLRYAWHVAFRGCEVSPHRDDPSKVGTHILYFNTSEDWSSEWGGSTLVLDGKKNKSQSPDFIDFRKAIATEIINNHSFLFKNSPKGWHGVKPLNCPEEKFRRLFNIIFEFPDGYQPPQKAEINILSNLKKILSPV